MTRSGEEYIAGLRDGRSVILDGERVDDVTTHPAFAEAVRSAARLYDIAHNPATRETMTVVFQFGSWSFSPYAPTR